MGSKITVRVCWRRPWRRVLSARPRPTCSTCPAGDTSLTFVTVGDPDNAPDPVDRHYGSVPYAYQMGKYDVTLAQYAQFLNAVAKTDPYGLYNCYMGTDLCHPHGISQSGSPGSYQLLGHGLEPPGGQHARASTSPGAMRPGFATGWTTASRPRPEGNGTTETGAYTLNGDTIQP